MYSDNESDKAYGKLLRGDFWRILLTSHGLTKDQVMLEHATAVQNALDQTRALHKPHWPEREYEFESFFKMKFCNELRKITPRPKREPESVIKFRKAFAPLKGKLTKEQLWDIVRMSAYVLRSGIALDGSVIEALLDEVAVPLSPTITYAPQKMD